MEEFRNQSWEVFVDRLESQILEVYIRHEKSFDRWSIHGRMHICRCLIFAEAMTQYYLKHTTLHPSPCRIRYAVAFHDAGRQGNGRDIWEADSAAMCARYLEPLLPTEEAWKIGKMITKTAERPWPLDMRIVHDADVLDIMRPCCGHSGRAGFRQHALRFLGKHDPKPVRNTEIRAQLIEEAWFFIQETERIKENLGHTTHFMRELLRFLEDKQRSCPFLFRYLFNGSK